MTENFRVKINVKTGEFEFEGSEDFIKSQILALPDILVKINGTLPIPNVTIPQSQEHTEEQGKLPLALVPKPDNNIVNIPENFGEWFNKFPAKIQQVDLVLVTGYFKQKFSTDNAFETSEVNKLLKEQGVKLTNSADSLKTLQRSKHVIIVEKRGKLNRFRISPAGESRINGLLQPK